MNLITNQDLDPLWLRQGGGSPGGVVAVAAEVGGVLTGLAASSFTTVSLEPPLVSISLAANSTTWADLRRARRLGLTVLAQDDAAVCRQLSGPMNQRFDGVPVVAGTGGAVLLGEGTARFECEVHQEVQAGDHVVVIMRVLEFDHADGDRVSSSPVPHPSAFTRLEPYKELARTEVPLAPVLAHRWSPRSFDAEHVLDDESLSALLEAARWAPSASNHQPRRVVAGRRGSEIFERLLTTLTGRNRLWAPRASALVMAVQVSHAPNGMPYAHADYDTGQAIAHLVVQAEALGLSARQMGGFDPDAAAQAFELRPPFVPRTITAIGAAASLEDLDESIAGLERERRERIPLSEFVLLES